MFRAVSLSETCRVLFQK